MEIIYLIYLLVGLVVGAILGIGLTKYLKQNKQLLDISNFENNIKNLQEEVRGYKEQLNIIHILWLCHMQQFPFLLFYLCFC